MIIHIDRLRAFRQAISNLTNTERYMKHKEPEGINHTAYPDGRIVKFIPLRSNVFIRHTTMPN
jgi:hypothetical protein